MLYSSLIPLNLWVLKVTFLNSCFLTANIAPENFLIYKYEYVTQQNLHYV